MKSRALIAIAAAFPLTACLSFGEAPPATLMTLSSTATLPAGTARTARAGMAVVVLPPSAPQELSVLRVPVRSSPTELAYLKDAQWVEPPTRLFRNLLAETIATRTGRPVLDLRQYAMAPGARLSGRLANFGLDAPSMNVIVTYDAALARPNVEGVETRRFEARVPVSAPLPGPVAIALNQAANQVADEVAAWIGN